MATWTFAQIQDEVRYLTGRFSENDISTSDLQLQINRFYQFVFPADVKLERNHTTYEFLTTPFQPFYTLPNSLYTNLVHPPRIDNKEITWYQDNNRFIQQSGINYARFTIGTGDGSTTTFSTTLTGVPIQPDSFYGTDDTETFEDATTTYTTADITLTGSSGGSGTLNYANGTVSLTFNTAPSSGTDVYVKYISESTGQPKHVLSFNNQLQLFPVPDGVYRFSVQAYSIPSALSSPSDTPLLEEWGPAISTGTAREIFRRYGQMEAYVEMTQLYKEQLNYVLTKTIQGLMNERSTPNF